VMEEGCITYSDLGVPQGGVISPLLSNIYLHEVLDKWFEEVVKTHLKGKAFMVRFADDAVLVFKRREDAERVMEVLPKRFEKYGLKLHPEKTRLLDFKRPGDQGPEDAEPATFNFLGFTHFWARSQQGYWVIKRKTMKERLSRALKRLNQWLREVRHEPIAKQHKDLCAKVRGHIQYYGIIGNSKAIGSFVFHAEKYWKKWLGRRSYAAHRNWEWFSTLKERFPLPGPKISHSC